MDPFQNTLLIQTTLQLEDYSFLYAIKILHCYDFLNC